MSPGATRDLMTAARPGAPLHRPAGRRCRCLIDTMVCLWSYLWLARSRWASVMWPNPTGIGSPEFGGIGGRS